jgi:sugar lactone lactonase YvrE
MNVVRAVATVIALACVSSSAVAGDGAGADVTTVAGTGAAGMADGPALSATFLMPSGIARAGDGTLYVADEAAQRIRAIANGRVTTVAGGGDVSGNGLSVLGAYRDGPALDARFDRPEGLALARDGALYVADSKNACVRVLRSGVVTTAVGKCGESGTVDGGAAAARLKDPRALAFDPAGNLYIADFDWGVRKVDARGNVTTLHFTSVGDRRVWGLTVGGDARNPVLVVTTPDWVIAAHLRDGMDEALNTVAGTEANVPFGTAGQIAALDARRYVFTDLRTNTVRYLRLPAHPYATTDFTRVIAGGRFERPIDNAGFADGERSASRLYAPRGIALADGYAFVADTGNRRIRRVRLLAFGVPESGDADVTPYDAGHYHISLVGPSWVYWDSLDRDSICGQVETAVDAAHALARPARCHSVRIDAATFGQVEDYVKRYLPAGPDLIVLHVSPLELYTIFKDRKPPPAADAARIFGEHLAALQRTIAPRARLMLFWTYQSYDVSDVENLFEVEENLARRHLPAEVADDYYVYAKAMMAEGERLGIASCDGYPDFVDYEKAPVAGPLYGTDDSHLNRRGSDLSAAILSRCIAKRESAGSIGQRANLLP